MALSKASERILRRTSQLEFVESLVLRFFRPVIGNRQSGTGFFALADTKTAGEVVVERVGEAAHDDSQVFLVLDLLLTPELNAFKRVVQSPETSILVRSSADASRTG